MYFKQEIGKNGEELAEVYLKMKGYKIVEKNFRSSRGEIDIIATENKKIVFIEIKTRNNTNYGLPSESVTTKKLEHIYKCAEYYLFCKKLQKENARIDVIEIYLEKDKCTINHLKQVV